MSQLPYLTSTGNLGKAFEGIRNAAVPPKVTQDFVKTVLQIPGGSGDNMTTFLRRVGFVSADGSPSGIYKSFRNPSTSKAAVAEAMRGGFSEIFRRNQYAYRLDDKDLKGLVVEITGSAADARSVGYIVSTFKNMKSFADFDAAMDQKSEFEGAIEKSEIAGRASFETGGTEHMAYGGSVGLNLGYTINLNLPASSDIEVFNAIFKSLKENLLKKDG